ncbi:MAG: polysaccharide biosynthesis protein [Chitinophagaceae bacterium]|nr:polysaccharide biosynthesis protein [Chitinophagaceae bacterium]
MGIIQSQSIKSTLIITLGFAIGAFNTIILAPKLLTPEQFGLTRIITEAGITMATLCTLGSLPIIYKFFPLYRRYLPAKKNDLPFFTLAICLIGFLLVCTGGYFFRDLIVRKYSEKSPLFVQYSYLVYPFCLLLLLFMWMESFAWSFKKGTFSNAAKETMPRIIFTLLLVLVAAGLLNINWLFILFSFSFLLPVLFLFIVLRKEKEFVFNSVVSPVTSRLKGKMMNFGLFLFGAQFLNILSRTADTFILSSKGAHGLADAAVFTIAMYVVTVMDIPQRSITSISIPVLAESWRTKNLKNISNVYTKSVANLLVVGFLLFGLMWLNIHSLAAYLGKNYYGIEELVLLMGIAKLIDLGTGTNAQIIATSSFWRVDFTTNVIYTLLALPLNYILISRYGLLGAAYSTLISLSFYNVMRFGFLWYKFNLQPYNLKDLFTVIAAVISAGAAYFVPHIFSAVTDIIIRSGVFLVLFVPAIYFCNVSGEITELIKKYTWMALGFLKIKK